MLFPIKVQTIRQQDTHRFLSGVVGVLEDEARGILSLGQSIRIGHIASCSRFGTAVRQELRRSSDSAA